jgi:hypothetical protein
MTSASAVALRVRGADVRMLGHWWGGDDTEAADCALVRRRRVGGDLEAK